MACSERKTRQQSGRCIHEIDTLQAPFRSASSRSVAVAARLWGKAEGESGGKELCSRDKRTPCIGESVRTGQLHPLHFYNNNILPQYCTG